MCTNRVTNASVQRLMPVNTDNQSQQNVANRWHKIISSYMSNSFVDLSNLATNIKCISFNIVLPKSEFQLLLMSKPAIENDIESAFYHLSRSTFIHLYFDIQRTAHRDIFL